MRIGFFQFSPAFGRREENLERIVAALDRADADLVVLPELSTSGYQFTSSEEAAALAEDAESGPTCTAIAEVCRHRAIYVVAGIAEAAGGRLYNTAILVGPSGLAGRYRKVHLFREEKQWFAPGENSFQVFQAGETRLGMMICFDWIFPEAARSLALAGADIICHPANLVLPFCQDAMKVRCLENGIFAVTANRTGAEARNGRERLVFTGGSQIVGPKGEVLYRAGEEEEALLTCEIDPLEARDKRITPENHLFDDRRPDLYRLS